MTDPEKTFDAAAKWLAGRVNLLTRMTSAEIALSPDLLPRLRTHAFFSARVAEARILDALRSYADRYAKGEIDAATARLELKKFLAGESAGEADPERQTILKKLSTTARLDLILSQTQLQAAAIGARETALDPDLVERFPYFRYVPSVAANRREEHRQYYNIVLPKTHPFWLTHTPPLGFNCRCGLEELTAEEAGEIGIAAAAESETAGDWKVTLPSGERLTFPRSDSGYVFDIGAAFQSSDMGSVPENYRRAIMDEMRDFVGSSGSWTAFYAPGGPARPGNFAHAGELSDQLDALAGPTRDLLASAKIDPKSDFRSVNQNLKLAGIDPIRVPAAVASAWRSDLSLGKLHPAHMAAFGFDPDDCDVVISSGSARYGLKHFWKHHKTVLADPASAMSIFRATLGNPAARVAVNLSGTKSGGAQFNLALDDPDSGAFLLLRETRPTGRGGKKRFEVVSFHRADDAFRSDHWALRFKKIEEDTF